ncbi:unnamed protein product, partial [marine sediment metagenome]
GEKGTQAENSKHPSKAILNDRWIPAAKKATKKSKRSDLAFYYATSVKIDVAQKDQDLVYNTLFHTDDFFNEGNIGQFDTLINEPTNADAVARVKKTVKKKQENHFAYRYVTSEVIDAGNKDQELVFNLLYHADRFFDENNIDQLEAIVNEPSNHEAVERLKTENKQTDSGAYKRRKAWVGFIRVISFGFKKLEMPTAMITDDKSSICKQAWVNYQTPEQRLLNHALHIPLPESAEVSLVESESYESVVNNVVSRSETEEESKDS